MRQCCKVRVNNSLTTKRAAPTHIGERRAETIGATFPRVSEMSSSLCGGILRIFGGDWPISRAGLCSDNFQFQKHHLAMPMIWCTFPTSACDLHIADKVSVAH